MLEGIKKLLKNRYFYIGIIVAAITAAMLLKLVNLQIVNGSVLDYYASRGYYSVRTIEAQRGKIYDRNGKLIAYNRTGYNVQVVKNSENSDWAKRDQIYYNLLKIFEKNGDSIENLLKKYITPEIEFGVLIDDDDDPDELDMRKNWIRYVIEDQFDIKYEDIDQLKTARDVFSYFRKELFEISEEYDETDAYNIMAIRFTILMNGGISNTTPQVIATDVSEETMSEIETRHLEFPGVSTKEVYFRQYNDPQTIAHILGYVRAMSEEEYEEIYKESGYSKNEIVGKEGIEKAAEKYLRGTKGSETIYIDKDGRELGEVSKTPAVAGEDIYLTIDLDLQEAAIKAMEKHIARIRSEKDDEKNFGDCVGGAIVVMDINSGDVLASVSYPDFDPNIFLAPSSDAEAQQAITDLYTDTEKSASLNRATQGLYAPGSVFKPIVAIAALEEGKITKDTTCYCNREGVYANFRLTCLGRHGNLDLIQAIVKSCNIYFYDVGVETGISVIDQYAKAFGLGENTGIEISEYQGARSNEETMRDKEIDLTHVWSAADTAQTSIGQLYCQFTPMQMARYAAALGNGGNLITPHLIQKRVAADGTVVETEKQSSKIEGLSEENLAIIKEGMIGVVGDTSSSIYSYFKDFGFDIAGKTGTPETGLESQNQSSNGTFICYAPADNPEIAVSVVLEHGVWGTNAAILASDVLAEYFGTNDSEDISYIIDYGETDIIA